MEKDDPGGRLSQWGIEGQVTYLFNFGQKSAFSTYSASVKNIYAQSLALTEVQTMAVCPSLIL